MSEAEVHSLEPKDSTKQKKAKKPRSAVKVLLRDPQSGDSLMFESQDAIDSDLVREQFPNATSFELWRLAGLTTFEVVPEKTRVKFKSVIHRKKNPKAK